MKAPRENIMRDLNTIMCEPGLRLKTTKIGSQFNQKLIYCLFDQKTLIFRISYSILTM